MAWGLTAPRFVVSMASRHWIKFTRYAKQAGTKWVKICLSGLCLKQLDVYKFESAFCGLLSYQAPACYEEINTTGANIQGSAIAHSSDRGGHCQYLPPTTLPTTEAEGANPSSAYPAGRARTCMWLSQLDKCPQGFSSG